jgi:hypothetical protein
MQVRSCGTGEMPIKVSSPTSTFWLEVVLQKASEPSWIAAVELLKRG